MIDVVCVVDCETTGLAEPVEPIELGYLVVDEPATLNILTKGQRRYKPSKPIEMGALATHHILDEELEDCPPSSEARGVIVDGGVTYMIAHNVDYDYNALGKPEGVRRIDTCALAKACWPECDGYSLTAFLYFLDRHRAHEVTKNAHRDTLADCRSCLELLGHIIAKFKMPPTWERLWEASEKARIPKTMPFGKHRPKPGEKGPLIRDLPADYLEWCLRQDDMDPYVLKAVRMALKHQHGVLATMDEAPYS